VLSQASTIKRIVSEIQQENFAVAAKSERSPRVMAITGGKGGVGKTLTTANLGLCLTRLGMRTLLIDGDFGLANLDVVLNLRPEHTLDDVLAGEKDLKDIILDGPEGLRVVPSASGLLKISELGRMQKLLLLDQIESLDEEFDVVLIDTPAGISKNVQYWTSSAAEVVVVTTPEPAAMADAYATMKVLSQTVREERFRLVVNQARNDEEGLRVFDRMATLADEFLNVKVDYLGCVLFDDAVRTSVRERVSYVQRFPFSAASRGMRAIAAQVVSEKDFVSAKGTMQFFWKRMVTAKQQEVFA
jgi:flagellar biosynthesis protein FlhG